jgi:cell division protein FtsB
MEPDTSSRPAASADTSRADWRSLARLRERVETAAREIERLRVENAALAQRVTELQNNPASAGAAGPIGLSSIEDTDALRARIEGFIRAIDEVLEGAEAEPAAGAGHE